MHHKFDYSINESEESVANPLKTELENFEVPDSDVYIEDTSRTNVVMTKKMKKYLKKYKKITASGKVFTYLAVGLLIGVGLERAMIQSEINIVPSWVIIAVPSVLSILFYFWRKNANEKNLKNEENRRNENLCEQKDKCEVSEDEGCRHRFRY